MKRLLLASLLPLMLAGCLSDQKRQVAQCSLDARKVYPGMTTAAYINDPAGGYIQECMQASGYEFTFRPDQCQPSKWVMQNPYCYRPVGWIASLIYRAEMAVQG